MNQVRSYYIDVYNNPPTSVHLFQAHEEELLLSCMPCSIDAKRVDIQFKSQDINQPSSKINQNKSIGGKAWKVLNTDLAELLPK